MSKIKVKGYLKYIFCVAFVVAIFSVYVARLVNWQIVNGEAYRERANKSSISINKTDALRGEILDINGEPLSVNVTGHKIVFDRFSLEQDRENKVILNLIELMDLKKEPWIDELPIFINKEGQYEFIQGKEKEIRELKSKGRLNVNSYATAEECMDKLVNKYNCKEYNKVDSRNIVSVKYNMSLNGYYDSMASSYTFAEKISPELMAIVSERFQDIPGVRIGLYVERQPINSDLAPHIVGTVGKMSEEQYDKLKDQGYSIEDIVGKSGIEYAFEKELRGFPGSKKVELSRDGSVLSLLEADEAKPGHTIYLTIDSKVQKAANESLEKAIKTSGRADCVAGGVVALRVKDFSILAAATYPNFDLAKVNEKGYYSDLMKNKANPLFNRAFNGAFAPGSAFKPLVAYGALEEGVLTGEEKIYCSGVYHYPGVPNFTTKCLGVHRGANLEYAMAKSCNVYFSEAGRRLGIENMNLYSKKFGLGVKTGIELPETAGTLAGPEHSKEIGARWSNLVTIKAAIGQSDNAFSPLQLATYVATMSNYGYRYKTHLVRKITDYKRQNIVSENSEESPELVDRVEGSENNFKLVQNAMRQVAIYGTASNFSSYKVPLIIKTGTAQTNGSDTSTIIGVSYKDGQPDIAVGVVIEHGASGMSSKMVLKAILDAHYAEGDVQEATSE